MKLSELQPDLRNANKGSQRGTGQLEKSLRQYGAGRSILIDKHGRIIAGNKTVEGAASIGMDDVILVESDGTKIVAVQRTDLDLDDPKTRELAIADNRVQQVSLEWDAEVLNKLLAEGVDLEQFWFPSELEALLNPPAEVAESGLLPDADPDDLPEQVETRVKPGDLWQLGRHRVLCGDSTVATDVERLLAGNTPRLMITDPPYGVEYDANWRNEADRANGKPYGAIAIGKVTNDDCADWTEAWVLSPSSVCYCWHADRRASIVQSSLESVGFEMKSQIIWAKSNFAISRGYYHWKHEPCWYAVRKNCTAEWIGDHSQTTLWEIDKPMKSETGHSTQKPVECMARPIRNHAGDVYDPFCGSGTTLIACEQLDRTCYAMELSPIYCDTILGRYELLTGKQAQRIEDDGTTP